jgi:sensor c-di-GMP phosphodiesterase-like protein
LCRDDEIYPEDEMAVDGRRHRRAPFRFADQRVMLNNQRAQLDTLSHELLAHAEDVTTQIISSIHHAQMRQLDGCNKQAIAALREVIWKYARVEDIGIVENGKLACTANWGMLDKPLPLPAEKYVVPNGYSIYKGVKNYLPYGVVLDMSQQGNIVSFTSHLLLAHFPGSTTALIFL